MAVCPAVTVWLDGCVTTVGATGAGLTVKVAVPLVIDPAVLLTTTVNELPLSPVVVAGVVYVDPVAPEIFVPFFFHW